MMEQHSLHTDNKVTFFIMLFFMIYMYMCILNLVLNLFVIYMSLKINILKKLQTKNLVRQPEDCLLCKQAHVKNTSTPSMKYNYHIEVALAISTLKRIQVP